MIYNDEGMAAAVIQYKSWLDSQWRSYLTVPRLTPAQAKARYLGTFEPDPRTLEYYNLLKAGDKELLRQLTSCGYFGKGHRNDARHWLEQEEDNNDNSNYKG